MQAKHVRDKPDAARLLLATARESDNLACYLAMTEIGVYYRSASTQIQRIDAIRRSTQLAIEKPFVAAGQATFAKVAASMQRCTFISSAGMRSTSVSSWSS